MRCSLCQRIGKAELPGDRKEYTQSTALYQETVPRLDRQASEMGTLGSRGFPWVWGILNISFLHSVYR